MEFKFWIIFSIIYSSLHVETNAQPLQLSCNTGWTHLLTKCYLVVPHHHTWINAKNYCSKFGAVLAQPKGYEISQSIYAEAGQSGITSYWIGYNRIGRETDPGTVGSWSDGQVTGVEVGVWAQRQPNITAGNCGYISPPTDRDNYARWSMDHCDNILPFICERTPCPSDYFTCSNGQCVSFQTLCNSANDCGDFSDEQNCDSLCNEYQTGTSGNILVTDTNNKYVPNMNCLYTIQTDISMRIELQFSLFDTEDKLDILEIWDGGPTIQTSTLVTRLSGSDVGIYQSFISSTNYLILRFTTDSSIQKSGFNITWSTEFKCEISRVTNMRLIDGQNGYVKALRDPQTIENCVNECNQKINCWGFTYEVNYLGDKSCFIVMEPPIIERDTCCEFYVKTCPGREGVTSLTELPLAETYLMATATPQYLYTPLYPFYYVGNIELKYTITTTGNNLITLQIKKVDLCCTDRISIHDGDSPSSPRLTTLDRSSTPGFVISTGQSIYIHMDLRQHWNCTGIIMSYTQGCTVIMTSDSGEINSPGYQGAITYPGIMNCTWTIVPPSDNSVRLTFMDMETETDKDFIQIYQGNTQLTPLHQGSGFSGTTLPPVLTSNQNLHVRFTTSAINNYRGFRTVYSSGCPNFDSPGLTTNPTASSFHAPDEVTLSCSEGYQFGGNHSDVTSIPLLCESGGQWNVSNIPVCERSVCGLAPELQNGYIISATGVQGGDVIQYTCNDGYTLIGQSSVTCQTDASWEEIPICSSLQCALLTSTFPSLTSLKGNGTNHGTIVQVTCPQYQQLIGPETIVCDSGEWKSSVPFCQPIPCPKPLVMNAFIDDAQTFTVNSSIVVECNTGYAVQTSPVTFSMTYRCGIEDTPQCKNINECAVNMDGCVGATCEDTDGSFICTCLPGYRPLGTSSTVCTDIDECLEDLDFCDQTCTNLPGSYECSCVLGFDLYSTVDFNGFELGTEEDGLQPWHRFHLNHSCILKTCDSGIVLNITDGKAKTSKSIFFYRDQVEYVCNIGYWTPGTRLSKAVVTCGSNGLWSGIPACETAFCNETFNNPNVEPQGAVSYNRNYSLECTMENGDIKVLQRSCGFDKLSQTYRTFGPDLSVCPVTDCGPVPQPAGMRDFVTLCTTYNCTVVFECKDQYVRKGSGSIWAPFVVICTADGNWDFGDLHCEGGQCPDPGYPVNGFTSLTEWDNQGDAIPTVENGSVATFTCVKKGYFPTPVSSITCRPDGSTMSWDGQVPECKDQTAPVFANCPTTLTVRSFGTIEFQEPVASDNTAVNRLEIIPENFQPGVTASSTGFSAYYIADDFEGNRRICMFAINIEDVTPPSLTCPIPSVTTALPNNVTDPLKGVTSDDLSADIAAFPSVVPIDFEDIGKNPIIQYVAKDSSNNLATCKRQLKIEAPKCNPSTLHVYNGNITCSATQLGYSCAISCEGDNVFYEDPSVDVLYVACSFGNDWSRDMPICTATDPAFYRVITEFRYRLTGREDTSCAALYESQIRNNLLTLTNAFTSLCSTVSSLIRLDVSPADDNSIEAVMDANGDIIATLSVDITPEGLNDSVYTECSNLVFTAIDQRTGAVSSIATLEGGPFCPETSIETFSANNSKSGFACSNAASAAPESSIRHVCLACPPGTLREGFNCVPCPAGMYNDGYYREVCFACPNDTNSKSTGLMYQKSCYDDCGQYLYSSDGKAPCTDCPQDTYWTNRTYCTPCPANTHTKGRGAISPNECIGECAVGHYSSDGLVPCNPCPKHFYQVSPNSRGCSECPKNEVTLRIGSTSSINCTNGFDSQCLPNPCNNGGVCSVFEHLFMCACPSGFTGRRCETPVDTCILKPCYNGGTCIPITPTNHTCQCPAPFTGDSCEIDEVHCTNITCENNGTCIEQRGGAICACPSYSGYYGSRCQYTQNPCTLHPCENGGRCVEQANFYRVCDCLDGFTGVSCGINIDECLSNPCMNGGVCQDSASTFNCLCYVGYTGKFCHLRDSTALCGSNDCTNGIGCVDDYVIEEKYCLCGQGSNYDDTSGVCSELLQYCDNLDCGSNGQCFTYDGGYNVRCKCNVGYGGELCTVNDDECTDVPCKNGAVCTDGIAEFICNCTQNGTGGSICEDNMDDCMNCVASNTDRCSDYINDYKCYCFDGFMGENCQTKIPSCDSLPCQHNGSCVQDTTDNYTCICLYPWTGMNCDTEINNCDSGTECENGGTCLSTSDGFSCMCEYGYIGERCQETYDVCIRLSPCVGNSSCLDIPPIPICTCDSGYTGLFCETYIWSCTNIQCQNGGTCIVQNNGVTCACPVGYTSSDCSVEIDECNGNVCPTNSVCQDNIGGFTCVCQNGKIGENCEKDFNYNFDYVIGKQHSCSDYVQYSPFTLTDISAISVTSWIRFTHIVHPDSIFILYGSQSSDVSLPWTSQLTLNRTHVTFNLQIPTNNILMGTLSIGDDIADGLWHHVAITWSNVDGYLTLYIDGQFNTRIFFGENQKLPENGWVLLGSELDAAVQFQGRISRFFIFNQQLNDSEVTSVYEGQLSEQSVLYQENALMGVNTINYNSQLTNGVCTSADNCPDTAFNAGVLPTITHCPDDQDAVIDRVARPQWTSPTFTNTDTNSRVVTHTSGETDMTWGIYGIGVAEYSSTNKHAAVCTFRLFNRRSQCGSVTTTSGMTQTCEISTTDDIQICQIGCDTISSLNKEGPVYYTCSKFGTRDKQERQTPFYYPVCSASVSPPISLTTTIEYNMSNDCATVQSDLDLNITQSISYLDGKWSNGMCVTAAGNSDLTCSNVDVQVTCVDSMTARVVISMLYLSGEVRSGSTVTTPETAVKIGFADDSLFNFDPVAVPSLSTLVVSPVQTCPSGSALVYDRCVACGSGTYYNSTTMTCEECSVGSYRTVTASTPLLSGCTLCPGSETTADTGSQSDSQCFLSCFYGNYVFYNSTTEICLPCPVGFYNDEIGKPFCKPCAVDKTTRLTGSTLLTDCIGFSQLLTTTTSSALPGTGASKEGEGLSAGLIALIVICCLILVLLITFLILCLTKRLPCFSEKVVPGDTPWKHVNKYGETNVRHVNYRLSDIKDKKKFGDKLPIYPEPVTPEDTLSTDISIHVPVFVEKLNGNIHKKNLLVWNGRASDIGSDLDKTFGSEREFSQSGRHDMSMRSEFEFHAGAHTLPTNPRKHRHKRGKGRPPADLSTKVKLHPRTLSPIAHTSHSPEMPQTSEYVRPLPPYGEKRLRGLTAQYEEFLEAKITQETSDITPPQSTSSQKILLDSEDEDYR